METRSSREERRAKKKKEKKTAVHSTRRAFTRVFEEEREGVGGGGSGGPKRFGNGALSSKCRACRCLPRRARPLSSIGSSRPFPRVYLKGKVARGLAPGPFTVYLKKNRGFHWKPEEL